jgi:hypothetical protein
LKLRSLSIDIVFKAMLVTPTGGSREMRPLERRCMYMVWSQKKSPTHDKVAGWFPGWVALTAFAVFVFPSSAPTGSPWYADVEQYQP